MIEEAVKYSVGALLYSPALNKGVSNSVINEKFGKQYSLAFCLEDTVADEHVEEAETVLLKTLNDIQEAKENSDFYLPKIFIRVRNPEQLLRVFKALGEGVSIVTGFIFPKYCPQNMEQYNQYMRQINEKSDHMFYMMPTLESRDIVDYRTRQNEYSGSQEP